MSRLNGPTWLVAAVRATEGLDLSFSGCCGVPGPPTMGDCRQLTAREGRGLSLAAELGPARWWRRAGAG